MSKVRTNERKVLVSEGVVDSVPTPLEQRYSLYDWRYDWLWNDDPEQKYVEMMTGRSQPPHPTLTPEARYVRQLSGVSGYSAAQWNRAVSTVNGHRTVLDRLAEIDPPDAYTSQPSPSALEIDRQKAHMSQSKDTGKRAEVKISSNLGQLFAGVSVYCLRQDDSEAQVAAMLVGLLGGEVDNVLGPGTLYILTSYPPDETLHGDACALTRKTTILLTQWVAVSLLRGERQPVNEYRYPFGDKRPPVLEDISLEQITAGLIAASRIPPSLLAKTAEQSGLARFTDAGRRVVVLDVEIEDDMARVYRSCLAAAVWCGGGFLADPAPDMLELADVYIGKTRQGRAYALASKQEHTIIGSLFWLTTTMRTGTVVSPSTSALFFPGHPRQDRYGLAEFQGQALLIPRRGTSRDTAGRLCQAMGATYRKEPLQTPRASFPIQTEVWVGDTGGPGIRPHESLVCVSEAWLHACFATWTYITPRAGEFPPGQEINVFLLVKGEGDERPVENVLAPGVTQGGSDIEPEPLVLDEDESGGSQVLPPDPVEHLVPPQPPLLTLQYSRTSALASLARAKKLAPAWYLDENLKDVLGEGSLGPDMGEAESDDHWSAESSGNSSEEEVSSAVASMSS
ncbi:hypothetical protein C8F01DRAFT_1243762 [Mycena amicta]|nr:hypothetical protein C8F01DRAFT_1243762 [Mycena amicta]